MSGGQPNFKRCQINMDGNETGFFITTWLRICAINKFAILGICNETDRREKKGETVFVDRFIIIIWKFLLYTSEIDNRLFSH